MSHPLDNIDAKLERAEQHITDLQIEVETLLNAAPYRTITDEDPEELRAFDNMLAGIVIPPRISILAGEAIHQTRSALDHLASELVLANHGTISNETQFPIYPYRPSTEKESAPYERRMQGMTISAKALIDTLQPCNGPDPDDHPLTILKRLNNRDKHRALLVAIAVTRPLVTFTIDDFRVQHSPDDPADRTADIFHPDVQRGFAAYVVFPECGSAKNKPILEAVAHLWAHVTFAVMCQFRVELTRFPWER